MRTILYVSILSVGVGAAYPKIERELTGMLDNAFRDVRMKLR